MLEKDLFEPVRTLFERQGYKIDAEVKGCDVVAVKDDETLVIELKMDFNLALVNQIVNRQTYADIVYAAIARPKSAQMSKRWRDIISLVRRLEAGLIIVSEVEGILMAEIAVEPAPFTGRKNAKRRHSLKQELDNRTLNYNTGGSVRKKIMTAYKENAIFVACCLAKLGSLSTRNMTNIGTGKKTSSILSKNYYGWYEKNEDGAYSLTEQGFLALEEYEVLAEHYFSKIEGEGT